MILGDGDTWFEPDLRLPGCVLHMHMGTRLLTREEVETVTAHPKNRRTHVAKDIRL